MNDCASVKALVLAVPSAVFHSDRYLYRYGAQNAS
jgi:hypothetical protein